MAFQGTTQKCMACEKTVYLVDKLTADNRVFHKSCFRCHHCKGTLKLGNYNSFEGVLYCRPHYDQQLKRTGSLDKSFEGTPKVVKPEKPIDNESAANKVSSAFGGTREKCVECKKTVYPIERVTTVYPPLLQRNFYFASHSQWSLISQKLLQMQSWRMYNQPFQLYCTRRNAILQAPPHPTHQRERKPQPA